MGNRASEPPTPPPPLSIIEIRCKAKEWQWQIRSEVKAVEKEVKRISTDEGRIRGEIEAQAARDNVQGVQTLARSLVRSRKTVERLEQTKANLHAVSLQLSSSVAGVTTSSSVHLSSQIMRLMNEVAGVAQVSEAMQSMRDEMAACAAMEEEVREVLEGEGEAEAADLEVQRVLEAMALERMGPLSARRAAAAAGSEATAQPPLAAPLPPPTLQPRIAVEAAAELAGFQSEEPSAYVARVSSPARTPSTMAFGVSSSAIRDAVGETAADDTEVRVVAVPSVEPPPSAPQMDDMMSRLARLRQP